MSAVRPEAPETAEPSEAPDAPAVAAPVPVVEVQHLGLVGPEGPVFADVSLAVEPGRLTVVVGPGGSGRSSLLLALCGRMRGCTGTVRTQGRPARTGRRLRALRRATSVARISTVVVPEPRLSVAETVVERGLLDGVPPRAAAQAFAAAEAVLGVHLDRASLVEQLTAYERTALAVALALVRPSALVVLDDLDADLDLDDQRRLADALVRVASATPDGPAVLASSTEPASVPADAALVTLAPIQEP